MNKKLLFKGSAMIQDWSVVGTGFAFEWRMVPVEMFGSIGF